jgi:hypothetical protein
MALRLLTMIPENAILTLLDNEIGLPGRRRFGGLFFLLLTLQFDV